MNCPVCDERMREVEKQGVQVDICPACKGVWLDRGELDKILEIAASGDMRSEAGTSGSSSKTSDRGDDERRDRDEHRDRDDHGDHEKDSDRKEGGGRKRSGSWIGDILGGLGGGD